MTYELYPAFKHWMPENGNVWFYSDPHFGDKENWLLRKQFVRDINNIEAFDSLQIATINKTCGKNDTLVILGDVGDIEYVRKLKAKKKILILGNHDQGATNYKRQIITDQFHIFNTTREGAIKEMKERFPNWKITAESLEWGRFTKVTADNGLFDEVYEGALMITPNIILSHEPIDFPYAVNIHGHDHSNRGFKDGLHINCCAEHINLTPICLSHIVKSGLLKNTIDIHREAIEKAKDHKK